MSNTDIPLKSLMLDIHDFVRERLDSEFKPEDISFALAYSATQLGLHITNDSTAVFPVILRAMAQAVDARSPNNDEVPETENTEIETVETVPANAIIH